MTDDADVSALTQQINNLSLQIVSMEKKLPKETSGLVKATKYAVIYVIFQSFLLTSLSFCSALATTFNAEPTVTQENSVAITQMNTKPLNSLHYIAGSTTLGSGYGQIYKGMAFDGYYYGEDYVRAEGSPIYAPYDGTISFRSNIGGNTPQIGITSLDGTQEVFIMHLNATVTQGNVSKGDLIGTTSANGAYSNNIPHEHVSYYVNGKLAAFSESGLSYEGAAQKTLEHKDLKYRFPYGTVIPCTIGGVPKQCKMSHYTVNMGTPIQDGVPLAGAGTTNCWKDCEYTYHGFRTRDLIKDGGCYVAAPKSVAKNTEIVVDGITCYVVDSGGKIVQEGDVYWLDVLEE